MAPSVVTTVIIGTGFLGLVGVVVWLALRLVRAQRDAHELGDVLWSVRRELDAALIAGRRTDEEAKRLRKVVDEQHQRSTEAMRRAADILARDPVAAGQFLRDVLGGKLGGK